MKHFRSATCALFAAFLAFGASSAGRAADAPLTVVNLINLPADSSSEVYYAEDMGFFKDAGLDVRITPMTNSGAIIAAVAGGGGDIGNSVVGSVADARGKGIPVLYIAPAGLSDNSSPTADLVTAKDSPIKNAAGLAGKTIAVSGLNDLAYFATRLWIDKNGGNSAESKYVELPFPAMAAALAAHRVDAAYIVEPFYAIHESELQLLGHASAAVSTRFLATGWIASESWLQSHADIALRFAAAIHRTALWANGHHRETAAILVKYLKIDPTVADHMNRAVYATALEPRLVQPPIDAAAKYTGQAPVSANSLVWAPGK